jgi:hypothetical protein
MGRRISNGGGVVQSISREIEARGRRKHAAGRSGGGWLVMNGEELQQMAESCLRGESHLHWGVQLPRTRLPGWAPE